MKLEVSARGYWLVGGAAALFAAGLIGGYELRRPSPSAPPDTPAIIKALRPIERRLAAVNSQLESLDRRVSLLQNQGDSCSESVTPSPVRVDQPLTNDEDALDEDDEQEAQERANALRDAQHLVEQIIAMKHYTLADRRKLFSLSASLRPEDQVALMASLIQQINDDEVSVE